MFDFISAIFATFIIVELIVTFLLMCKYYTVEEWLKDHELKRFDKAFLYGMILVPLVALIVYIWSLMIFCGGRG